MVRRVIRFRGRVQGVGFRATCRSVAAVFPITGWVRNEPDTSVHLEIQGDPTSIEAFLRALEPRIAGLVTEREMVDAVPDADEAGFRIAR